MMRQIRPAKANFEAQGKTPAQQDIKNEAIRTLGEAKKAMKQVEWEKIVDGTASGKLAKNILDSIPKDIKRRPDNDANAHVEYTYMNSKITILISKPEKNTMK